MAAQTAQRNSPARYIQGIEVPDAVVDPASFFALTRRKTLLEKNLSYTLGTSTTDTVELRKSDILDHITIRFSGSLVLTKSTGTIATTARWPYDMLKNVAFTANGAANIIKVSGMKLKVRDYMKNSDLTDRGVAQTIGGAARTQGTLAKAYESWGVGSNTGSLAAGTYPVELEWTVPVAEDSIDLNGAIFLATSSTDCTLQLDYEQLSNLFTLTGDGAAALTGTYQVVTTKFSVPTDSGKIIVPDLSYFHSMIQSNFSALANGENEIRLAGQGAGKQLLRLFYQVYNGAVGAPLAMNATNFGKQSWRYGGSETPDEYIDGQFLRSVNEGIYNSDIGGLWGFGSHEFEVENAFRDTVDEGTTSELRLVVGIQTGVTLTNARCEYVAETMMNAGQVA